MKVQSINNSKRGLLQAPGLFQVINAGLRNLLIIGLLLTTMVFQRTTSMPSRLTIRSTRDDGSVAFPERHNRWQRVKDIENANNRETARQANDVESIDSIVFPTEKSYNSPSIFTPGPPPECRKKTYCENTDYYPVNYVNNVIEERADLKILAGIDEMEGIVQRFGDDTTTLCTSEERLVYPTAAQNKENNWLFVLNQENFKQGVRIETCLSADSECMVIGDFVEGYKTTCKQKYILRQLAAITANGTAIRDLFRLPSSCCCHLKFDGFYNRMGLIFKPTVNNQSPVSKTPRR